MVNEWTIYGNDGAAKAVVKELELHDEWMAECFITVTVKSAEPIDFAIGDYITYRDEKYSINYDPTIIKKARRESYGEGFVYDNIKLAHDAQNKVVTCDFTDIVLNDNNLHYTSLPTFPFFCESVDDLLDRIQACLEELYPGEFIIIGLNTTRNSERGRLVGRQAAFEEAYREYVDPAGESSISPYGKQSVALTVDNITCWDAVTKIHEDFELNFIQRGYVIVAGTSGSLTPSTFKYGKGKGLYELERICDSSQQIVTRLRAYGNETNIPNRYYANLNTQCFATVTKIEANYATSGLHYAVFLLDLDFASRLFNNRSVSYPGSGDTPNYIVEVKANDITVRGYVTKNYSSNNCYVYCEYTGPNPEDDRDETDEGKMNAFSEAIKQGDTVYFVSYINKDAWPTDHKDTASENLPNNMAVNRLMLPGFPNLSLYDWVKANGGTNIDDEFGIATINGFTGYFSKDKYRPWIQSMKSEEYGIRPASIYFDGSGETTDIHPTIEEMTYGGSRIDVIVSADQITDNGVYDTSEPKNFKIILPNLGFDLSEVYKDDASIDMKDGMCGARSFKFASRPKQNASGQWECTVQRAHDDSLDLWFPYNAFQIRPNDHYVLVGIDMSDAYVNAAAEKLFNAAIEALQKNDKPTYTYQPRIDEIWMQRQHDSSIGTAITSIHDTIKAGDIFAFEDEDLGIDGSIVIDVLTIKENGNNGLPTYEVTLRDEKQVSTIQKMIDKAVTSSNNSSSGSGNGGYTGKQMHDAIENYGSEYYLSKINDDTASGEIGFLKGLWIAAKGLFGFDAQGNIKANGGSFRGRVTVNDVRSDNYTGSGIADTGWAIVNDNGSGSSQAVFDYLTIRKKMIVNSLEIKETHVTAGDIAQTCASADIARTDYYEVDDQGNYTLLGYAKKKMPWYLRGMAVALGKRVVGSKWFSMFGHYKEIRVTLTAADLSRCNRIRCYFLAKDGEKEIENWFRVNDLIRCQTWNIVKASRQTYTPNLNDHDGNIFWWRKCVNVSWNTGTPQYFDHDGNKTANESDAYVNEGGVARLATNGTYSATVDDAHAPKELDGNTYHWFDVAYDYDAEQNAFREGKDTGWCAKDSDIPALGDKVVQFGNSTDPDRMNITLSEVNGSGNIDAPDIKMYRGVYTFNLERSWWGGVPCKIKMSPATGCDFYAPHFRFITETGSARVPFDRAEKYWTSIALERDEYNDADGYEYPDYSDDIKDGEGNFVSRFGGSAENPIAKNYVRKCYYYDRVTHNGSLWLCSIANETWYWRATADFGSYRRGDRVTDYATLTDAQKDLCEHVRSYTNQEPSIGAGDWTRQVDKGDPGAFKSRAFCRTNTDISTYRPQGGTNASPVPTSTKDAEGQTVSGITWTDGAPDGDEILWSTTAWFYSDGTHSSWTAPAHETDTQTQDIEFSPSYYEPAAPYGDDASQKDLADYKTQRHNQKWYDPSDTLPSGTTWSDMIWRAERQIKNGVYSGQWSISRIKGESSNRLDLTNQADLVSLDADGKVRFDRTVVTIARIFEGGTVATANVEKGSTLTAANMKYGSTSTCTVSDIVNGQVTITWNFKKGDTITADSRLIVMKLRNVEYSASFSLGTTDSEYIYQLNPSPSEISFSRTSTNTLTPSYVDLYCGYTKSNGSGTTTISNPTASKIDDNNYLYYRVKDSNGSWGSWTAYSGYIRVYSSTTNIDYELAISTASSWRNVSDSNAYEREVIPVVKDGKNGDNSVRVDLDNNNDTMLYSSSKGLISGQVSSQAHLYDGAQEITSNITWKISASSGVTLENNGNAVSSTSSTYYTGENDAWITTGGKVYVNGMSAMSGSVTVQATYTDTKGNTHTKYDVLTLKKIIDGDKYDLVIEPNAIPYNISETWSNKTISIKANRLSADGTKTENITLNSGGIYLAAYYKTTPSGSESWNQITGSFSVTEAIVSNNDNILIELRKEKTSGGYSRTNPSTYTIEDYETIPVNKSKNGKNSVRLTLDNEHEDFLYSKSGLVSPLGGATSQIRLYDGNTTKTYGINSDFTASIDDSKSTGISTISSSDNYAYITPAGVLTVKGISTDTALVVVKSSYGGSTYYAEFTANKTEQDKFDIVVNPNAIAFNNSEAWTDKDIKISANCTSLNGSFTEKYELQNSASNGLRLYYAYVDSSGTIGTLSQVTSSLSNVTFSSNVFTFTFKESAKANSGIYFELRYYTSSSAYRMCDYETVEIAKTENGEKGASVTSVDKYFKAVSTNSTPSYDSTWTKNATPNDWSETNKYLFCREYTNYSDSTGSWGSVYLHSVWGEDGKDGKDGKYKLQAYKALDTQPSAPTGTSVTETYLNDLGWYLTPTQAQNNAGTTLSMSYTFTSSSWTRSGNTFTSPASTAHSQYYQARIGFTTSVDNVVINIKITASSEANYDWGYVGELDTDHSSNMNTYGIRVSGNNISQSYSLSVPSKGTHYFDIAYKKDGFTSSFNDNIIVQILSAKTVVEQIWESQTWVEKNTSGTEEAQGWSAPVRWNGTAGKQGHVGRWYEYYGDVTNSTVTLTNTDDHGWFVKKGSYFYMLISSSASTSTCPTIISSTDDWEYMGGDRQYYIAKAFFGDYAQFGSFIINGDWMLSTNGTINGTAYNDGATYGGAAAYKRFDPRYPNTSVSGSHTAPNGAAFTGYNFVPNFAVDGLTGKTYQNAAYIKGEVHATSGEFTGKVTAESGTIGGFDINSDKLTNTNYDASVSIQDANGNQISRIGKEAKDAMTNQSCSLEAQSNGTGTYNTALYLNAQGATFNYAFHGNGNGVLNGLIFGFKTKVYEVSGSGDSTQQMSLTDGATFVFHGSKSSGWANFKVPTLNNVKQSLGLKTTDNKIPFAIEVNFINHSSYDSVTLQFYNSSRTDLPKWYDYNFEGTKEDMQLARGDFARFLLTYDGLEYRANCIIHHDDGWG